MRQTRAYSQMTIVYGKLYCANVGHSESSVFFQTWKHRGATVPKPFNLSGSNDSTSKRKRSVMEGDGASATDSYQSMAYQVYKFQTTTPPRFRTKKATNEASCKSEPAAAPKITCPKTPNLATSSRARPVSADVLSKEEQEEQEAQAIKK